MTLLKGCGSRQTGHPVGYTFTLAYLVGSITIGKLSDIYGLRNVLGAILLWLGCRTRLRQG